MTTGGWIIMLVSVVSVTTLFVGCMVKVFLSETLSGNKGEEE